MSVRVYSGPHADRRRGGSGGVLRALPWLFALATIAAQIAWPLTSGSTRDALTVATVVLFFLASATHALVVARAPLGPRLVRHQRRASASWPRSLGTRTGLPFGDYAYSDRLGPDDRRRARGHPAGLGDDELPGPARRPPPRARPAGHRRRRRDRPRGVGPVPRPADGRRGPLDLELQTARCCSASRHPRCRTSSAGCLVVPRPHAAARPAPAPAHRRRRAATACPRCCSCGPTSPPCCSTRSSCTGPASRSGAASSWASSRSPTPARCGPDATDPRPPRRSSPPERARRVRWPPRTRRTTCASCARPPPTRPPSPERVSVLVPARDEAARIGACLVGAARSRRASRPRGPGARRRLRPTAPPTLVQRVAGRGDPRVRAARRRRRAAAGGLARQDLGVPPARAAAATGSVLRVRRRRRRRSRRTRVAASVALLRTAGLDLVSPYPRQLADGALAAAGPAAAAVVVGHAAAAARSPRRRRASRCRRPTASCSRSTPTPTRAAGGSRGGARRGARRRRAAARGEARRRARRRRRRHRRRHLPDVRRRRRARRGLHQVAVVGVRLAGGRAPGVVALLSLAVRRARRSPPSSGPTATARALRRARLRRGRHRPGPRGAAHRRPRPAGRRWRTRRRSPCSAPSSPSPGAAAARAPSPGAAARSPDLSHGLGSRSWHGWW